MFPPFSIIARILLKSEDEQKALEAAKDCYTEIRDKKQGSSAIFRVQAMRAPIKRISNEYRFQVVVWIKTNESENVLQEVYKTANKYNTKKVVTFVEINPTTMR